MFLKYAQYLLRNVFCTCAANSMSTLQRKNSNLNAFLFPQICCTYSYLCYLPHPACFVFFFNLSSQPLQPPPTSAFFTTVHASTPLSLVFICCHTVQKYPKCHTSQSLIRVCVLDHLDLQIWVSVHHLFNSFFIF